MKHTKKIGIIGGVGPQATQYIYEHIIYYAQKKYGAKNNDDYPFIIIESVPIPDFISDTKKIDSALSMLKMTISRFNQIRVDAIAIASNTVHILLPKLQKETSTPFLSTIDLVVSECKKKSYQNVGVLASPVLIRHSLYKKALEKAGIKTILPVNKELKIVEQIIRSVLSGRNDRKNKDTYVRIVSRMLIEGADAIVLGCTELPLAINYEALGKQIVNSDEILAEGIVDFYYQNFSV